MPLGEYCDVDLLEVIHPEQHLFSLNRRQLRAGNMSWYLDSSHSEATKGMNPHHSVSLPITPNPA